MTRTILLVSLLGFSANTSAATFTNLAGGPPWLSGAGQIALPDGYNAWKSWMGYDVDIMAVWAGFSDSTWADIASGEGSDGSYLNGAMQYLPKTTPIVVSYPMVPSDPNYSNRNCAKPGMWDQYAAGSFDSHWRQFATNFKAKAQSYGRNPANHVIRLGWEMNGDWYAWSICDNVTEFKRSWERVVNIIRAEIPGILIDFSFAREYVGYTAGRDYGSGPGVNLAGFLPASDSYDVLAYSLHDGYPFTTSEQSWIESNYNPPVGSRRIGLVETLATAKAVGKRIAITEWHSQMDVCWAGQSPNPALFNRKVFEFLNANRAVIAWDTYLSFSCTNLYDRQATEAAVTYKTMWGSGIGGGSVRIGAGTTAPAPPRLLSVN